MSKGRRYVSGFGDVAHKRPGNWTLREHELLTEAIRRLGSAGNRKTFVEVVEWLKVQKASVRVWASLNSRVKIVGDR